MKTIQFLIVLMVFFNVSISLALLGGKSAKIKDYPYISKVLTVSPPSSGICTATAISSRLLITAAHCFADLERFCNKNSVICKVSFNKNKAYKEISAISKKQPLPVFLSQKISVVSVMIHPDYE